MQPYPSIDRAGKIDIFWFERKEAKTSDSHHQPCQPADHRNSNSRSNSRIAVVARGSAGPSELKLAQRHRVGYDGIGGKIDRAVTNRRGGKVDRAATNRSGRFPPWRGCPSTHPAPHFRHVIIVNVKDLSTRNAKSAQSCNNCRCPTMAGMTIRPACSCSQMQQTMQCGAFHGPRQSNHGTSCYQCTKSVVLHI
jgi:hypothetical protein